MAAWKPCTPQDLRFYRPLGRLAVEVHQGGRYVPLSEERAKATPPWVPILPLTTTTNAGATSASGVSDGIGAGAGGAAGMGAGARAEAGAGAGEGAGAGAGAGGAADAGGGQVAAGAALKMALQQLFLPSGPGVGRQPSWMYINHLGWCRG